MNGLRLTFHLAGINNQNFIMRDEETGTYWQQISGRAIAGPLAGQTLQLVPSDELSLALWKSDHPAGGVLGDAAPYAAQYAPKDWDVKMQKTPTVLSYAEPGRTPRDLMLGVRAFGTARAFPFDLIIQQKLVNDHVGGESVLLVVGPDEQSVRAFRRPSEFYRTTAGNTGPMSSDQPLMMDADTGSQWNFLGCAIDGKSKGVCLERIEVIKDYWFDWRHYNPGTTVYSVPTISKPR